MKYLKIFTDFSQSLTELDDAEIGRLFLGMLKYADTRAEPELKGKERIVWPFARFAIDNQFKSYQNKVNAAAVARSSALSDNRLLLDDISGKQDDNSCYQDDIRGKQADRSCSPLLSGQDNDNDKDKDKDKDKEKERKEKRKKDDMTSIVPAEPEKAADLTEDFAFGGEAAEMAEKGEAEVMSFQVSLTEEREACRAVIEKWNALGIQPVLRCSPTSKRGRMLRARLREYGLEKLLLALDNVNNSKFLKGAGNNGWVIDFDWFLGPNHFNKVLEGAYNDRRARKAEADPDFDPGEIDRLVISK